MNIAVIFAGGTGQRMNTRTRPKQFLELHGKPIIIHTIEQFENHPLIDAVVVVCIEGWIKVLERECRKDFVTKVASIVPGGATGQESICRGVFEAERLFPADSIALIHDGVRPLIDEDTITRDIACAQEHGNAITVVPATETVIQGSGGKVENVLDRRACMLARAPQCFVLRDIAEAHRRALADGLGDAFIDSCDLMRHYGHELYMVEGCSENIKITTPSDFYVFRAISDARESSQIFGI